jgi:hypothetical protein
MASNMMSSMDNDTLKNMMKSSGMNMDLSDSQIDMMKGMFKNPDMIKNCMNSAGGQQMKNNFNTTQSTNTTTTNNNEQLNTSNQVPQQGGMDFSKISEMMSNNPDMMKMAMNSMSGNNGTTGGMPNPGNMDFSQMSEMLTKNPELMKMAMNSMGMGGAANGADPNMMMNSMQTILWLMSFPQRIKAFFQSTRGILVTLIIVILIISYFYG